MSTYIGIDPATHCGWAILDQAGQRLQSGVWDLSASRTEGSGMVYLKFEKLFRSLLDLPFYDGYRVGYEQQINRFAGAVQPSAGIQAAICRICEEQGVPYQGLAFSSVKKVATGKGNSPKAAMILAAEEHWRETMLGADEADALWVAETLRRSLEQ